MSCGCTSTPTTPAQTNTPNVYFTWGSPTRYLYVSYEARAEDVQKFREWQLAESDLYLSFTYKHQDKYEDIAPLVMNASIDVSENEDGSDPYVAKNDYVEVANTDDDKWYSLTVTCVIRKGLYYRALATPPVDEALLTGAGVALYAYSEVTVVPCTTPISLAPVSTTCSCDACCDPCAPSGRCNTPPPMPVIVVSSPGAALPKCSGPNTFEPVGSFTMPAVEANAPLRVCDPNNYPIGHCVYLSDGTNSATLRVTSRHTTNKTIQLDNYGAPDSAAGGTVFGSDTVITPIGPCPETVEQVCERAGWELGEAFTPQAATVDTTLHVSPCIAVTVGQKLFVKALGWFEVKSIDDVTETGTELTVWTSQLLPGVTAGVTTAASGGYVIADEPPGTYTPTSTTISAGFNLGCGLGTMNNITGGTSDNSASMVLAWDANCMITGMTFRDPNAGATVETLEYQASLQYSSDAGATWNYLIQNSMEATNREGNGNPVTKWVSLTAGTYIWRFLSTDMTGTPGAPTPLEPPEYTHLNVAILAVRATAVTS